MKVSRIAGRAARTGFALFAAIGEVRLRVAPTPRARARRMHALCAEVASIHGLRVAVIGALPDEPCVLVANHLSYLDPIVVGAQLGCFALAKREVASWPVIGPAASQLGAIFVDRACVHSRAAALLGSIRALRAGVPVLNFPEGTTTDGRALLPFAPGIFGAARIAAVPVVPIAITYGTPRAAWIGGETFLPHYARTASRSSLSAVIRVGRAIDPYSFASAHTLAAHARRAVIDLLRPEPEDPHVPSERFVIPPPRPDAVLPLAEHRLRVA
ncbi:MAG TPA: lysophospholipid acyltransferase family protein [Kofleriaceae bacterium]|nr:lysophospholipid acyltransferase family protein [Kofleriaceae bacterium]